jgi:hypothetical protein
MQISPLISFVGVKVLCGFFFCCHLPKIMKILTFLILRGQVELYYNPLGKENYIYMNNETFVDKVDA